MKVGVVTRQLKIGGQKHDAVVSAVFTEPQFYDSLENYFQSKMEYHKDDFVKQFPEFKSADWSLTILDADR